MAFSKKQRVIVDGLIAMALVFALLIGVAVGLAVASTKNTDIIRDIGNYEPALPSQVLDRHGRVITEFFGDQKREIVSLDELPKHLIYALLTREDRRFYSHRGLDLPRLARASFDLMRGRFSGGASTITQQVAGWIFADRRDKSFTRKLKELWYAFQVERVLSKDQILELYVNLMPLGHGTDGVEAASQFYFGHSAREITLAQSAILVPLLSSPTGYSPIRNPETARERQRLVLNEMISLGYITAEEAAQSVTEFWDTWDYSRSSATGAYLANESLAPYFTEYVRIQLENLLYGAANINRDGYIIYTSLDLDHQRIADNQMNQAYREINSIYRNTRQQRLSLADESFIPIVDLLALFSNNESLTVSSSKARKDAISNYHNQLNPMMDMLAMMTGNRKLMTAVDIINAQRNRIDERNIVEGALVSIDNNSGHILSMVGGRDFEITKLNRAAQARIQPGSAFKPLYYSAAISSRKFTTATRLHDGPMIWTNSDDTVWEPENYLGEWRGSVLLRYALATSMNVPSIQVLEGTGFDAVIDRSAALLGRYDQRHNERQFPRKYPLALGIITTSPLEMARAYATFAALGNEVEPLAIIHVEDREGNSILEHEKNVLRDRRNRNTQILTPQEAYIMVDMLKSTVDYGTLANRRRSVGGFGDMPMAGKTGTTQNWGDAWTVGFSPYVTTAIWFGFDQPGNSLGRFLTGATAAGPVWARYMKEIHDDLEPRQFRRPQSGLVTATVCRVSGQIPTRYCNSGTIEEIFIAGTEPRVPCEYHDWVRDRDNILIKRIQDNMMRVEVPSVDLRDLQLAPLDPFDSRPTSQDVQVFSDSENPLLD